MILNYRAKENGERRDFDYLVFLSWTLCQYGGARPWFLCPSCRRRVAILYGGAVFACRHCYRASGNFIDFAPGLIGRVAVVGAGNLEVAHLKSLLLVDADASLRQLHRLICICVYAQAMVKQFALCTGFMIATLWQMVDTST